MKPNKKYVDGNGVQYAMYPNPNMNITQTINGATSHRGTNAIDDAQGNAGISNGYAPCDVVCVATDYVNGNAMFWQSQKPVHTLKYGVTYIYMMVIHDNTANAHVGMKISQGQQLFSEGTAGMATGNHNHIEVGIGKYPGYMYTKSGYLTSWGATVYMMPGNVDPSDVFFVDDTNIINGGGLLWKKTGSSTSSNTGSSSNKTIKEEAEHYAARFKVDKVNIRKGSPTGASVGQVNTGDEVEYFAKCIYGGHRWIKNKDGNWIAISNSEERGKEMWVDLIDPSEMKSNKPSQPTTKPTQPETPAKPTQPSYDDLYDPIEEPDMKDEIIDVKEFANYGLTAEVKLVDKRLYKSKCPYVMKNPKGIVAHNFGASAGVTADNSASAQNKEDLDPNLLKSWHLQVDDKKIIQTLPLNRNSFSTGDGGNGDGNRNYISIEIMKDMPNDNKDEADKAQDNGALAIAILYYKKGWSVKDLKKHQDFTMTNGTHKYCPHRILDNGWDKFLVQVQKHYDRIVEMNKPVEPEKPVEPTNPDTSDDKPKGYWDKVMKVMDLIIEFFSRLLGKK